MGMGRGTMTLSRHLWARFMPQLLRGILFPLHHNMWTQPPTRMDIAFIIFPKSDEDWGEATAAALGALQNNIRRHSDMDSKERQIPNQLSDQYGAWNKKQIYYTVKMMPPKL